MPHSSAKEPPEEDEEPLPPEEDAPLEEETPLLPEEEAPLDEETPLLPEEEAPLEETPLEEDAPLLDEEAPLLDEEEERPPEDEEAPLLDDDDRPPDEEAPLLLLLPPPLLPSQPASARPAAISNEAALRGEIPDFTMLTITLEPPRFKPRGHFGLRYQFGSLNMDQPKQPGAPSKCTGLLLCSEITAMVRHKRCKHRAC